jgi:hypothetical protein
MSPPGRGREVTITEHPDAPRRQAVRLRLTPEAAQGYAVWQKEMPAKLPEEYEGRTIHWFNNFGLKRRGSDEYTYRVPAYTIIVDKGPRGATLVYFDEQSDPQLNPLETTEVDGQLHATLDLGDPTIGWAG